MSYIGQTLPTDVFGGYTTDTFAGDGSATTFTLSQAPFNEQGLIVVINNVIQQPTTNYTVSGTTLTIVGTAVASGDVIYARHTGVALPIGEANALDLQGQSDKLILDADADTTISADTDDQIDIKIAGADDFQFTANTFTAQSGSTIAAQALTATTIGATGVVTANAGVVVDNFTIDGTEIDLSSGNFTLDVAGTISIDADGGDIMFKDGGTEFGRTYNSSSDFVFYSAVQDKDIKFQGNDGGSTVTALTLDMSEAGVATFNSSIITSGMLNKVNDSLLLISGGNATNTGSNLTLYGGSDGSAGTFRFRNGTTTHFNIAGNGDLTGTDQSIGSISDSRLKENITDFTYDVVKFKQFKPKTFDWKNPAEHNGKTNNRGFIAQEIAAIDDYWTDQIPIDSDTEDAKLISADSEGNHNSYSLKLGKKDAMYISVIQQLITRIEALEDA